MTAVTSLDDDVFVARWDSGQVEVYDANTFQLQGQITLTGVRSAQGLAACARYQCLYVSESNRASVHRAQLSDSSLVTKWSVANSSYPAGLSVNKEHNVVVACRLADKLEEYTTHGTLVREIDLRPRVSRPWHAIQLSTGNYAVSKFTIPGEVIVVGVDGQVVGRYPPLDTSDAGEIIQIDNPTSLAVTRNGDILVADRDNDRILSINRSMDSAHELALPVDGGIQTPCGLCLDESRGRVYVGEGGGSNRVLVFDDVKLLDKTWSCCVII